MQPLNKPNRAPIFEQKKHDIVIGSLAFTLNMENDLSMITNKDSFDNIKQNILATINEGFNTNLDNFDDLAKEIAGFNEAEPNMTMPVFCLAAMERFYGANEADKNSNPNLKKDYDVARGYFKYQKFKNDHTNSNNSDLSQADFIEYLKKHPEPVTLFYRELKDNKNTPNNHYVSAQFSYNKAQNKIILTYNNPQINHNKIYALSPQTQGIQQFLSKQFTGTIINDGCKELPIQAIKHIQSVRQKRPKQTGFKCAIYAALCQFSEKFVSDIRPPDN